MKAEEWRDETETTAEVSFWQRHGRIVLTAVSGMFTAAGFFAHVWLTGGVAEALGSEGAGVGHSVPLAARGLYALGILAGSWHILPKAFFALRRLRPDMNLLMVVAVVGAVGIGEWFEAATVSFLFAVSLALESLSLGRGCAAGPRAASCSFANRRRSRARSAPGASARRWSFHSETG